MEKMQLTPGPWQIAVGHSSNGSLGRTGGFAYLFHAIRIGGRRHTVAHTSQRISDCAVEDLPIEQYGPGYVRYSSKNSIPVSYEAHPDALMAAAAPELYEALASIMAESPQLRRSPHGEMAALALAHARGDGVSVIVEN